MRHTRPRIAHADGSGEILIVFDVRHHPKCDPRAAGPFEQWARLDRRKSEELAIHRDGSAVGRLTSNWNSMRRLGAVRKFHARGHQYHILTRSSHGQFIIAVVGIGTSPPNSAIRPSAAAGRCRRGSIIGAWSIVHPTN